MATKIEINSIEEWLNLNGTIFSDDTDINIMSDLDYTYASSVHTIKITIADNVVVNLNGNHHKIDKFTVDFADNDMSMISPITSTSTTGTLNINDLQILNASVLSLNASGYTLINAGWLNLNIHNVDISVYYDVISAFKFFNSSGNTNVVKNINVLIDGHTAPPVIIYNGNYRAIATNIHIFGSLYAPSLYTLYIAYGCSIYNSGYKLDSLVVSNSCSLELTNKNISSYNPPVKNAYIDILNYASTSSTLTVKVPVTSGSDKYVTNTFVHVNTGSNATTVDCGASSYPADSSVFFIESTGSISVTGSSPTKNSYLFTSDDARLHNADFYKGLGWDIYTG